MRISLGAAVLVIGLGVCPGEAAAQDGPVQSGTDASRADVCLTNACTEGAAAQTQIATRDPAQWEMQTRAFVTGLRLSESVNQRSEPLTLLKGGKIVTADGLTIPFPHIEYPRHVVMFADHPGTGYTTAVHIGGDQTSIEVRMIAFLPDGRVVDSGPLRASNDQPATVSLAGGGSASFTAWMGPPR